MNSKENIAYTFEPNQRLKAIQEVIKKRHRQQKVKSYPIKQEEEHVQFHQHGLPSPPLEDKKFMSSQEIKDKLDSLKQEKHELFQLMKKLLLYEQRKNT